jgi:hypothetical protein
MNDSDLALVELGRALRAEGYRFVTVTPETHARVLAAEPRPARTLRDVFGWGRPFVPDVLPRWIVDLSHRAEVLVPAGARLKPTVRFSSLGEHLVVHSAFPTLAANSVFFGPDTYRFCSFVRQNLKRVETLVDVGAGTGAGGIAASALAKRLVLGDVNGLALRYARVNTALAELDAEVVESDVLGGVRGSVHAVIANPPYLRDARGRQYRDGGGEFGEALAVRIVRESLARLDAGGVIVLYTGAPVVEGRDVVRAAIEPVCREANATLDYEELDPDVFGSEIGVPPYERVERIAAVGMVVRLLGNRPAFGA